MKNRQILNRIKKINDEISFLEQMSEKNTKAIADLEENRRKLERELKYDKRTAF